MKILPVIDLMQGCVVRGIGGRREEYRPIESRLAADSRPVSIGRALAAMGFDEVYVADLDAIAGRDPAWSVYESLAECGLRLQIDAGLGDVARGETMRRFVDGCPGVTGVIVGLETLSAAEVLPHLVGRFGPERLVFSLDLKSGKALREFPGLATGAPEAIADWAWEGGVRRILVLDLARVGLGQGAGTEAICRRIRARHPDCWLSAGGGASGLESLWSLHAAGCDEVLAASALHDGRVGPAELTTASQWKRRVVKER